MDSKRPTLKDIAKKMNVSLSTVHKALYDKKGIGKDTRLEILKTAKEMNFEINLTASALKRKLIKIAVVLPEPSGEERYFYKDFWKGIEAAETELKDMNAVLIKIPFKGIDYKHQAEVLETVFSSYAESVDGLLTVPWNINKLDYIIDKFADADIPVILVNTDAPMSKRICCVAPPAEKIGTLAGELMRKMVDAPGKIIIFSGNREIKLHSELSRGFINELSKEAPSLEIIEIIDSNPNRESLGKSLADFLSRFDDIKGIYSNNARNTLLVGSVISDMRNVGKVKVIGTDLFDESISYLKNETIQAIIYQNPFMQANEAVTILFQYIVKKEEIPNPDFDQIAIVLKSNLSFYVKK